MSWGWLAAAFGFALVDWYYVARSKFGWRALTKPVVILMLLAGFTLAGGWHGRSQWFGLGLLCCLVGDIFMILPAKFFLGAVFTFLPGYVLYSFGFIQGTTLPIEISAITVIGAAVVISADTIGFRELVKALSKRSVQRWLCIPCGIYMLGTSIMLISALHSLKQSNVPVLAGLLYFPGAFLIFFSDYLLAINRFVKPVRNGRLFVTMTYHLGQIALMAGVMLRG